MAELKEIISICCRPDMRRISTAQMSERTEQNRDRAQKGGNRRGQEEL